MPSPLLLALVLLAGCAAEPAPPPPAAPPPSAASDAPAPPAAPVAAPGPVGTFTATLSDGTALRGHAAVGPSSLFRLYAEGEGGLWHVVSVHPLDAAGPPAPGTYPLYSVAAVGQLAAGDERHRANPFSVDYVRQAGPTPRLTNASSAAWDPVGELVVTESSDGRVAGTLRFEMTAFSMDTMNRQPLTIEATFEATSDPRLDHYDAWLNRKMSGGP